MFELLLPQPLMSLIRRCEVVCVAACCGRDAFDPCSEHMLPWMREGGLVQIWSILDQLAEVRRELSEHDGGVTSEANEFNAVWDTAGECLEYLDEWREVIVGAAQTAGGSLLVSPSWLTSTVIALARGIYAERAFDGLPMLADALQDAGCDDEDILAHLRNDGPHILGCGVVDLLLRGDLASS